MAAQEAGEAGITTFFRDTFNTDALYMGVEQKDYHFLYRIREFIRAKSDNGKAYLSQLSEYMKMEISEVSKIVSRLEREGFLEWETDTKIGRSFVSLTGKAVKIMDRETDRMQKCYGRITSEIDPDEINQMEKTMEKIRRIIKEEDAAERMK